ncbi:ubiquitin-conjugating enzyme E2 J1 [Thecamonas trahens ATCC 50062]|uniref:Ubiquitin-conjugating enzyme E2 J1 n=1 Tax=Thecamonas trahens ATCC 50062 TaxID=461836 RepID=A0A0L0D8K2_THETB|nr:ubiquitin-conjugating enzyme E2 J1 [Thecamonas trahens ATCC 50062]KNC48411.1 ubiquitin-conjugating enzyme E2 J1 [Thecamonas trahens ATCC 50062]|eukprot:XP_013758528.1 ubiquitin-conjugating enzyme E2 J1 [Thecamonas trahens ATCC 50062]
MAEATGSGRAETDMNMKNPAIRRLLAELRGLQTRPNPRLVAYPLGDSLFEWHFSIRGPEGTAFDGGVYHGRIYFPPQFPMKPPDFVFLTPSGRFATNVKICLSNSGYHPESWQPSWSVETMLMALIAFMPTKAEGAVGALEYPDDRRRDMAAASLAYVCKDCGRANADLLEEMEAVEAAASSTDGPSDGSWEQPWERVARKERERDVRRQIKAMQSTARGLNQWIAVLLFLFLLTAAVVFRADLADFVRPYRSSNPPGNPRP